METAGWKSMEVRFLEKFRDFGNRQVASNLAVDASLGTL
jgi:hypothetical protein